jgi:hypothetical protein
LSGYPQAEEIRHVGAGVLPLFADRVQVATVG